MKFFQNIYNQSRLRARSLDESSCLGPSKSRTQIAGSSVRAAATSSRRETSVGISRRIPQKAGDLSTITQIWQSSGRCSRCLPKATSRQRESSSSEMKAKAPPPYPQERSYELGQCRVSGVGWERLGRRH